MDGLDPISPLLSPAKARRDAAQARDWAYVSSWLTTKYSSHPVPRFERNAETLKCLLDLVRRNEAADQEVKLIHRAEEEELKRHDLGRQRGLSHCQELIDALEYALDQRGKSALNELAEASVVLGTLSTDPIVMGERIVELSHDKFEMEQQLRRIGDLQSQLEREMETMNTSMKKIKSQGDETAQENMQQQTAQLGRETKQFTTKAAEYSERIAVLERYPIVGPDIQEVQKREQVVKKLRASVKALERQIAGFHGLPPDLEASRAEYQRAQRELDELRQRRDAQFHTMVDK